MLEMLFRTLHFLAQYNWPHSINTKYHEIGPNKRYNTAVTIAPYTSEAQTRHEY